MASRRTSPTPRQQVSAVFDSLKSRRWAKSSDFKMLRELAITQADKLNNPSPAQILQLLKNVAMFAKTGRVPKQRSRSRERSDAPILHSPVANSAANRNGRRVVQGNAAKHRRSQSRSRSRRSKSRSRSRSRTRGRSYLPSPSSKSAREKAAREAAEIARDFSEGRLLAEGALPPFTYGDPEDPGFI